MTKAIHNEHLAALATRAAEAARELEEAARQYSRFGDEFEIGTVLKFKHQFTGYSSTGRVYDYVAMRADNGYWYLTCNGTSRMDWVQMVHFIGDQDCWVVKATGWKAV